MPRTIRFHLDENCHRAIAEGLRRRGIDVSTTPQSDLLSTSDEEQLGYCNAQGRVLFTQDRDFLRLAATGVSHCGIVYCNKDSRTIGEIVKGLVLIWEILDPGDIGGKVEYL